MIRDSSIWRHACELIRDVGDLIDDPTFATRRSVDKVLDRSRDLQLRPPGAISPNGACRIIRTADNWLAVNLPRDSDLELVPAWLGVMRAEEPWNEIVELAAGMPAAELLERAMVLGLAVSIVGECARREPDCRPLMTRKSARRLKSTVNVVDLSSLWAGPLCGAILADAGADVVKVESVGRPDPTPVATPLLDTRLNGAKRKLSLDFRRRDDIEELTRMIESADVVITSARPRALTQLGLSPERMFNRNKQLIWLGVTGHGWRGAARNRVGFGDDAAAAGGLVFWNEAGEPEFAGDALADPFTGLVAARSVLKALRQTDSLLLDASLSGTAGGIASRIGGERPAPRRIAS